MGEFLADNFSMLPTHSKMCDIKGISGSQTMNLEIVIKHAKFKLWKLFILLLIETSSSICLQSGNHADTDSILRNLENRLFTSRCYYFIFSTIYRQISYEQLSLSIQKQRKNQTQFLCRVSIIFLDHRYNISCFVYQICQSGLTSSLLQQVTKRFNKTLLPSSANPALSELETASLAPPPSSVKMTTLLNVARIKK